MSITTEQYEVVVVGVGGMGSAATYQLAKRGVDVLGLEQYNIPHQMGSSHGYTRIIRLAYHEDPAYVSLLHRAYDLWEQIETEYGEQILFKAGSISAGPPSSELVTGAAEACEEHSLPYEQLSGEKLSQRFSGFNLPSSAEGVYQPDGGFVDSKKAIIAHVKEAHSHGAEIHARERVEDWQSTGERVQIATTKGDYEADRLVIAAGAWTGKLVESLDNSLSPERQVLGWFQPKQPNLFSKDSLPVFAISTDEGLYYGTPVYDVPGLKIGKHHHFNQIINPDEMAREPTPEDEETLRDFTSEYFPLGAGATMSLQTCIYTNSPDHDFVIDTLPDHPEVVVAGGFSGHGYKFASVVGEMVADLATDGETANEAELFDISRL